MQELPKSVIERLKSPPGAQEHPDADLLTAFSEQALTGRERERVLAHLAVCAACREAVALALPEIPARQPVAGFVPWYRRPQVFAWSGIAATVVVAVSLVANYKLRPEFAPTPAMEHREQTAATATAPAAAKTAPAQPVESKDATLAERAKAEGKPAPPARKQAEVAAPAQALVLKKEAKTAKEMDRYAMAAPPGAPAKEPAASGARAQRTDSFAAQPPASQSAPAPAAMDRAMSAGNRAAAAAESGEVQTAAPATAASAGIVGGVVGEGRAAPMSKAKTDKVSTGARWSISESGQLQRSADSGRTWRPVTVDPQATFRALAVVGDEVWAGGSAALLYHSSDSGDHWTRQTLPGSTATIVSLEFSDARHGVARTADGTSWSTSDGGQHWSKQ